LRKFSAAGGRDESRPYTFRFFALFAPFAVKYPAPNLLLCDLCALCGEYSYLLRLRRCRAGIEVINL